MTSTSPSLGSKEFEEGKNLFTDFARDTDKLQEHREISKPKTGVSLWGFSLGFSLS